MQRKILPSSRKPLAMKNTLSIPVTAIERAKAAWPVFGGVETAAATPKTETKTETPAATTTAVVPPPDPLAELAKDPAKLQQLLTQVSTLTTQLTDAQTKVDAAETEKTAAARAKQTKEEQLQADVENRDILLAKATAIIQQKVLENALITHKDYQWHDPKDALRNVDMNLVKITVDIEKGLAEIEGMDKEAKRIATEKPWMLKPGADTQQPVNGNQPPVRATGAPPAPPTTDAAKIARRNELIGKHPVISHGR